MGLDIYVGPLSRYLRGDWKTIVQQAAEQQGVEAQIVRDGEQAEPVDAETATTVVNGWITGLIEAIGGSSRWDDAADGPYVTDKPDWDGYGGIVLLAAFADHPALADWDLPAVDFAKSAALAATSNDTRFPTILSGVTWWLPLDAGPVSFEAGRPGGQTVRIGWLSILALEVEQLLAHHGWSPESLEATRTAGPPELGAGAMSAGEFGLAVLQPLLENALRFQQPLVLDY
jgi:hypothetical protein